MAGKGPERGEIPERRWRVVYTLVIINTLAVYFLLWLFPRLFS